jgi:hypothetical protein
MRSQSAVNQPTYKDPKQVYQAAASGFEVKSGAVQVNNGPKDDL